MYQAQLYPADQDPYNVAEQSEDAETSVRNIPSERGKYKPGNLKTLNSERNSDNCYAQQKAGYQPA